MRFHACSVTQLVVAAASYVYIVYSWYGRRVLCYVCIVQTGVNREYRNVNWVTMYMRASDKSCASHVTSLRHSGTISQRRGVLTPGTVHEPRHGTGYPDGVKSSLGNWGWGKGCEEGQTWDQKESMQEAGKSASFDVLCNTEKDIFGLEIVVCSTTQIGCSSLWNIVQVLLTTQLKSGDWRRNMTWCLNSWSTL